MGDPSIDSVCKVDVPALPVVDVLWSGGIDITNGDIVIITGITAHLLDRACSKVFDVAIKMPVLLCSEMLPRVDLWPARFNHSPPTDYSIGIYFFPEKGRYEEVWERLLKKMIGEDLALKTVVENVELLIFTSLLLPPQHHRFQGKYYMWGLFREKKASNLVNDVGAGEERNPITISEQDEQVPVGRSTELSTQNTAEPSESAQFGDQKAGTIEEHQAATVKNALHYTPLLPSTTTTPSSMIQASDFQKTTFTPQFEQVVSDNKLPGDQEERTNPQEFGCKSISPSMFNMASSFYEEMNSGVNGSADENEQNTVEPSESAKFWDQQTGRIEEFQAATVKNAPHYTLLPSTTTIPSYMKQASDFQKTTFIPQLEVVISDSILPGDQERASNSPEIDEEMNSRENGSTEEINAGENGSTEETNCGKNGSTEELNSGENGSACNKSITQVGADSFPSNLGQILRAINDKYGDIARDCHFKSNLMRSNLVEKVCMAVHDLQHIKFAHCQDHHLKSLDDAITDAECVNLDVKWLRNQQVEIKKTLSAHKEYNNLIDALADKEMVVESKRKILDSKIADLKKLKCEVNKLEHLLESAPGETERFDSVIFEYGNFPFSSVADGLF